MQEDSKTLTKKEALIRNLLTNLAGALDPVQYLYSLGFDAYDWQIEALDQSLRRLILNCARQSGKSTVIAAKAVHKAKFFPGSLILLVSPTDFQSIELMKKIEDFMRHDPDLPFMDVDSKHEKVFTNGSRILARSGEERSVRGISGPDMIIIDEASRVKHELYMAIRPMMTGADTELVMMSTPKGKTGFFYEAWTKGSVWKKIEVVGMDILGKWKSERAYKMQRKKEDITAYWSPRHTAEFLEEELEAMGKYFFQVEYCGAFLEPMDQIISEEDLEASFERALKPMYQEGDQVDKSVEVFQF